MYDTRHQQPRVAFPLTEQFHGNAMVFRLRTRRFPKCSNGSSGRELLVFEGEAAKIQEIKGTLRKHRKFQRSPLPSADLWKNAAERTAAWRDRRREERVDQISQEA